jgi:FixJ family two-component response regulator
MTSDPNPRIAVIDDDDYVSDPMRMLLELQGWSATCYKSCDAFLAELDTDDPPACMILDLHFPRMNGVQLQEHLKGLGIRIPTIVLTARPDGPLAEPALRAGAREIVTKPVDGEQLIDKIKAALAGDDPEGKSQT